MSIGRSTYNKLNSYGLPNKYHTYTQPYNHPVASAPAGVPAVAIMEILSNTPADFDGRTITFTVLDSYDSSQSFTLTFDDDTFPPSTNLAVNIKGLTTVTDIAFELRQSLELRGFRVRQSAGKLWVRQPFGGDGGNTTIVLGGNLTAKLEINGVEDFDLYDVSFYNGLSLVNPAIHGEGFGMLPGTADHVGAVSIPT